LRPRDPKRGPSAVLPWCTRAEGGELVGTLQLVRLFAFIALIAIALIVIKRRRQSTSE
jgi:hypothetical protein